MQALIAPPPVFSQQHCLNQIIDSKPPLFAVLLCIRALKRAMYISLEQPYLRIQVDGLHNQVSCNQPIATLLERLRQQAIETFQFRLLSDRQCQVLARGQYTMPLEQVLWTAALYQSQGYLISGHDLSTPAKLTHCPPQYIKSNPQYRQLAGLLLKQTLSVKQVLQRLSLSQNEIIGFYNAAWVSGLLEKINILKS